MSSSTHRPVAPTSISAFGARRSCTVIGRVRGAFELNARMLLSVSGLQDPLEIIAAIDQCERSKRASVGYSDLINRPPTG